MKYSEEYRLQVAKKYVETGNAKATSKEFGVPIRSVYNWGELYSKGKDSGLKKKSTRPIRSPNRTDERIEKRVCQIWLTLQKRNYSAVRRELVKLGIFLSVPTIKSILDRRGLK